MPDILYLLVLTPPLNRRHPQINAPPWAKNINKRCLRIDTAYIVQRLLEEMIIYDKDIEQAYFKVIPIT